MSYTKHAWVTGETITAEKLNNIEDGIDGIDGGKQNAPVTAGTAGQVLSLDNQLNPVWSTPSSGGDVTDVQINGTSILEDGVANIPQIQPNKYGMAKLGYGQGVFATTNGGVLYLDKASNDEIKNGVHDRRAIVPVNQHAAAFFGLAKAAGDTTQAQSSNPVGTYTDEAKAAIKSMLGVADGGGMNIVSLSGTQITQVGADNTFYVCGELTELTFTAPSVGITMIRFTSGTTPTVLTVNGVTSWMFDNDPTAASLEANKTYDINVLNGVGVVGWA